MDANVIDATQDRSIFATPCGLLFNELQKSPQGIMRALSDLLEFAVELDTGDCFVP